MAKEPKSRRMNLLHLKPPVDKPKMVPPCLCHIIAQFFFVCQNASFTRMCHPFHCCVLFFPTVANLAHSYLEDFSLASSNPRLIRKLASFKSSSSETLIFHGSKTCFSSRWPPSISYFEEEEGVSSSKEDEEPIQLAQHSLNRPPPALKKKSISKKLSTLIIPQHLFFSSEQKDEEPTQSAQPSSRRPPFALKKKSISKKLQTSTTSQPQLSSSESSSKAMDLKVKPFASKPIEKAPKKKSKM